jgi:hypothetical protein
LRFRLSSVTARIPHQSRFARQLPPGGSVLVRIPAVFQTKELAVIVCCYKNRKKPGADDQSAPGFFRKEKRGKKMKIEGSSLRNRFRFCLYVHNNRNIFKNQ